jgi:hypothetical protein
MMSSLFLTTQWYGIRTEQANIQAAASGELQTQKARLS